MEACVGVDSVPCFGFWCTTPHNALIGYGSLLLCICTMYAQCISNPNSIGNDEIFSVTVSWCVTCLAFALFVMDAVDCS